MTTTFNSLFLAAIATVAAETAPLPSPNHLIDHVAKDALPDVESRVAALPFREYVSYTQSLRHESFDRASPKTRERARSALLAIIAKRAGLALTDDARSRLLAAHAAQYLESIPNREHIDAMSEAIQVEVVPEIRFEQIMALAVYAQKSKEALPMLRDLLLAPSTKDILARQIAFELPGEDLRYRLFQDMKNIPGRRSQALKTWIRAKKF